MRVADVMSSKPVTVDPDMPVSEAFRVASAYGVQHLVVTEGRLPVGVVCVRCDLAKLIGWIDVVVQVCSWADHLTVCVLGSIVVRPLQWRS